MDMVDIPSGYVKSLLLKMAQSKVRKFSHEKSKVIFHSYVNVFQRVGVLTNDIS